MAEVSKSGAEKSVPTAAPSAAPTAVPKSGAKTVTESPRRAGRPSRPALTEADIAREALAIIDELGWAACTMKVLAHRLGVRAPSLYHHIDGQKGIVDLVRALVVREIHTPDLDRQPWDEAIHTDRKSVV